MNKKIMDKLVASSYKGDNINIKTVNKIVSLINKTDLKEYINGLKLIEKKKCLMVISPSNNLDKKTFKKLYPNKKIVFQKDARLMLGVKIIDNDIIHEFTLSNSLDKILNYIEQNYD